MFTGRIATLSDIARHRADELLDALDIRYHREAQAYVGPCPVHGGARPNAFRFYPNIGVGKDMASWLCLTDKCHADDDNEPDPKKRRGFFPTLYGLVRGTLSHQRYGWERKGDREASNKETVDFLCEFAGVRFEDVDVDTSAAERQRMTSFMEILSGPEAPERHDDCYTRYGLRAKLEIPATYYLARGISAETLDRYDIGLCIDPSHELHNRVVIPFYDSDHRLVRGCIGRSVHEVCPTCRMHHPAGDRCFRTGDLHTQYSKMKVADHFKASNYLYNYWFARGAVKTTRSVAIVEGAADVWRLVEAGIENCVALSGSALSERQQIILESSGAVDIYVLTDNDTAGERACEIIRGRCGRFARTHRPRLGGFKDVGEMSVEQVRQQDFYEELRIRP